jgi:hypothetical protein
MQSVDIDQFQSDVIKAAFTIRLAEEMGDSKEALTFPGLRGRTKASPEEVADAINDAEALVQRTDIRAKLCPELRKASDNLSEIAKGVVVGMVPVAMTTKELPMTALAFGALSYVVLKMGIHMLCPGEEVTKADEDVK